MTTIGKAKIVSQRLRESNRAPGQEGSETIDALIVELEKLEYKLQIAEECFHQVKSKFNETLNAEVASSVLEINSLNQVILGLEEAKKDTTRLQGMCKNLDSDGDTFWLPEWCLKKVTYDDNGRPTPKPTLDELRSIIDARLDKIAKEIK